MQNIDLSGKKKNIIKHKKLWSHMKMVEEFMFGDIEMKNTNFTTINALFF